MRVTRHLVLAGALTIAASLLATGQASPNLASPRSIPTVQNIPLQHQATNFYTFTPSASWELNPLVNFQSSEIKFNLETLMSLLRDNRHEGWVLAAYPDPKTSRPLIGAGFSLDLPEREHAQRDPLNPVPFLEPSSAQIWQAAGLQPAELQSMLQQFDRELDEWNKARFRRKIRTNSLFPEISEDDADKLLRVYAIQAIHNARAYCRNFDLLTGSQQMALSQMVYQMGVNLEEFTNFLSAINTPPPLAQGEASYADTEYWRSVQGALIHTDWARRYSTRAVSVIAMFDPGYASDPYEAEARVRAEVHPLYVHHHTRRRAAVVRTASASHRKSSNRRTRKS